VHRPDPVVVEDVERMSVECEHGCPPSRQTFLMSRYIITG
jgi:hypothetical protein